MGVRVRVCSCLETAQPDSASRQASLLTADEMKCLLTQEASAARAPPHLSSLLHRVSGSSVLFSA